MLKLGNALNSTYCTNNGPINMALIWSCYSPLLINKEIVYDQSNSLSAPLNSWVNTYVKPSTQGKNKGWASWDAAWGANL